MHTNNLSMRVLGTITGIGFILVGLYAIFGGGDGIDAALRERSTAFGVTSFIGGVWAVLVSWLDGDLSGVWCRQPRRWW